MINCLINSIPIFQTLAENSFAIKSILISICRLVADTSIKLHGLETNINIQNNFVGGEEEGGGGGKGKEEGEEVEGEEVEGEEV